MIRLLTTCLILLAITNHASAQQQYIITQYMFNGLVLNPAYAGSHESWSFTLMTRRHWSGIPGAPSTQSFTSHGPLTRDGEASAGVLLVKDQFGAISLNNMYTSLAYRINLDGGRYLSMGLQGGVSTFNVDLAKEDLIDPNDPALSGNVNSVMPNFGTGVYYHGRKLFAGLSAPFLLNNRLNQAEQDLSSQVRHYYLMTGGSFKITNDVKYIPTILLRYVEGLTNDIDITTSFLFRDIIWAGVTYRLQDSFDFICEIQLTDDLRLGYSFDLITSELNQVTSGSHELVLNYRLGRPQQNLNYPTRFR